MPVYTVDEKKIIESLKPIKKECKAAIKEFRFLRDLAVNLDHDPRADKSATEAREIESDVAHDKLCLLYEQIYVKRIEQWDRNNPGILTGRDWMNFQKNAYNIPLKKGGANKAVEQ